MNNQTNLEKITIEEVSLFKSTYNENKIVSPTWIKTVSGGLLVYDYSLNKLIKYDLNGEYLFSFGSEGRGPGEFQEISGSGFWQIDNNYMIFDRLGRKLLKFDLKGEWIADIPIGYKKMFRPSATAIEAINKHQFILPSNGLNKSLLSLINIKTEDIQYFGNAVVDNESRGSYDSEKERQAINSGKIPSRLQNSLLISTNSSGIFSFQVTTAILEKYSFTGDLIWSLKLEVPEFEGLLDHMFEDSSDRLKRGLPIRYGFNYGRDIYANEDGVAIMLNVPDKEPVPVVWVSNDGNHKTIVTFKKIISEQPFGEPRFLTISADKSLIFFVNSFDGEIYKAPWPS